MTVSIIEKVWYHLHGLSNDEICRNPARLCRAENEAEDTNTAREKAIAQLNRIRRRAGITTDLLAADYNQAPFGNAYAKNAV